MIMLVCMHAKSREHSKLQSQGQKKKKEEVQKKKKLGKQITPAANDLKKSDQEEKEKVKAQVCKVCENTYASINCQQINHKWAY